MFEHYADGVWHSGMKQDCKKCPAFERKAPAYLPEGYKTSTKTTIKDSRGSRETQHWSGRQDAHVMAQPARAKSKIKEI